MIGICRISNSVILTRLIVAKAELGTKRTDPETGKKFYDLNRDPIVSPYTGKSYPLSFFEETSAIAEVAEEDEVAEVDTENTEVELVSLEDADDAAGGDDIPDIGDDDVEIEGDDDDDTFLTPDEDDDDDDMSDIIGVTGDDDEV
nr:TIGR02300 family protein [Rhizobium sp. BK212]